MCSFFRQDGDIGERKRRWDSEIGRQNKIKCHIKNCSILREWQGHERRAAFLFYVSQTHTHTAELMIANNASHYKHSHGNTNSRIYTPHATRPLHIDFSSEQANKNATKEIVFFVHWKRLVFQIEFPSERKMCRKMENLRERKKRTQPDCKLDVIFYGAHSEKFEAMEIQLGTWERCLFRTDSGPSTITATTRKIHINKRQTN